jgi:arylsulfatase A-like enzyme
MQALIITADGLGAGWLGAYGNEWVATPHLDRLAAEGVVFDQHVADVPDAAGARRAWRTGRHHFPAADPPPDYPDLLAALRQKGVAAWLVHHGSPRVPAGFLSGWDRVIDQGREAVGLAAVVREFAALPEGLLWIDTEQFLPPWDISEEELAPYFAGDADAEDLSPILAPTPGIMPPDDEKTFDRLQRTFAAAVSAWDSELGQLLALFGGSGPLVVVTAGYGLPLGEHGLVGEARPWLHEERVHVPFVIRWPGKLPAGQRVSAMTQPVDLLPTLLAAWQVPIPADLHGHDLLPLARDEATAVRPYACLGLRDGDLLEWALRTPEWGYVWPTADGERRPALFSKPDDRWEVNDLRQHHLEWAEHLETTLRQYVESAGRPGPLAIPELDEELISVPASRERERPEDSGG